MLNKNDLWFLPLKMKKIEFLRVRRIGLRFYYGWSQTILLADWGAFAVNGLDNLCCLDDDLWNILLNTKNIPSFFCDANFKPGLCVV